MSCQNTNLTLRRYRQQGVSVLVALIMLLVLSLLGVSSMNSSVVELKMANSSQQQSIALNRAEELLSVSQTNIDAILLNPAAFDFAASGDGYYVTADGVDIYEPYWSTLALTAIQPDLGVNDLYVVEYLGAKPIPGESVKIATDGRIIGGAVHTFRQTTRSVAAKGAVRLVQSIYVSELAP